MAPPLVGVLHARARAICTARLVALHASAKALPTEEAVRWAFSSRLLHEIEQLGPGDFDDADEERATLDLAVDSAVSELRSWVPTTRLGVVDGERARFVAWLELREGDAASLPDVPMRRIATTKEIARLSRAFQERFPAGSGTPLPVRPHWSAIRAVLEERGIEVVWLIHPSVPALSMVVSVELLATRAPDGAPAWFPPEPAYVVDEALTGFVFVAAADATSRAGGFFADPDPANRIAPM